MAKTVSITAEGRKELEAELKALGATDVRCTGMID